MLEQRTMEVGNITLGMRFRADYGDLSELAQSIASIGLLQPPVVMPDGKLIAGARRVLAIREHIPTLTEIPVMIAHTEHDAMLALVMEREENTCRLEFAPDEAVYAKRQTESWYADRARERQLATLKQNSRSVNFTGRTTGETREQVAASVGLSWRTLEKAEAIVEAAEEQPELYSDLVEQMHRTRKVDGIHKKLQERKRQVELTEVARQGATIQELPGITLLHSDFYEGMKGLPNASVDVIVTDPPYLAEYLPLFDELAGQATRVLKPGGSLLIMSGQYHLPEVLRSVSAHIRYHWVISYLTPGGQSPQIWPRKVNTFWKPVLWFVNGDYAGEWVGDVCRSDVNDNDKDFHKWGQSVSGMLDLVDRFTVLGDVVLDPFCGAGTTGVAATRLGRKFIGIDKDEQAINIARQRLGADYGERAS